MSFAERTTDMEFFTLIFPLLLIAGPLLYLLVGLVPTRWANRNVGNMIQLTDRVAWTAFALSVVAAVGLALNGKVSHSFFALGEVFKLSVYFDTLSAVMLTLVSFIGLIVTRYTRNYLAGDAQQGRFLKWLSATIAAVLALTVSGHLGMFVLIWMGISLGLHQLLIFYPERFGARLAARKKFITSRLGDLSMIGAAVLTYQSFKTLDFSGIFSMAQAAREAGTALPYIPEITALLVFAAVLKSAQFPFHSWLPEVMETPTPVSALLHAGIINAGGFLMVRMSEVMVLAPSTMTALALIGGITALYGSVVMLTQNSVKVSLAYSTVAQMGFMLLQCGLGAFSAAVLHIIGHSLYKAHAFLSSGSVVETSKSSFKKPQGAPKTSSLLLSLTLAVGVTFGVGAAFGASLDQKPGLLVLGSTLLMGLVYLMWNSVSDRLNPRLFLQGLGFTGAVAVGYFALQAGMEMLLQGSVFTQVLPADLTALVLSVVLVVLFMAALVMQMLLPYRIHLPQWQAAYIHLLNGLYVHAFTHRLIENLWPIAPHVHEDASQKGPSHDLAHTQL